MLHYAGLTIRMLPSMVLLGRFPPRAPEALVDDLTEALMKGVRAGLKDLGDLERLGPRTLPTGCTRRSRLPILARLLLAYPGLQPPAIARLLNITPQGARKMQVALC